MNQLTPDIYTKPKHLLSNATIGQHLRHVIEFYTCIEKGSVEGRICYDDRDRNVFIESDMEFSKNTIEGIIQFLSSISDDKPVTLKANYSGASKVETHIKSSLFREIAYALDHTIHHMAIIKIALLDEETITINSDFGVAPSTLRHREECAR